MVYSFQTQAWEEQSGIELVVTDGQHVRSPGDAREEREGAGGGGGSSLVLEPCGAVAWLTLVKAGAVKKKVPQISLSLELQPVQPGCLRRLQGRCSGAACRAVQAPH